MEPKLMSTVGYITYHAKYEFEVNTSTNQYLDLHLQHDFTTDFMGKCSVATDTRYCTYETADWDDYQKRWIHANRPASPGVSTRMRTEQLSDLWPDDDADIADMEFVWRVCLCLRV